MYQGWKVTKWETPLSEISGLLLVGLHREGRELTLEFEAFREQNRPRWKVKFDQCSAFRCIDEAYRIGLWKMLDETSQRCGPTFLTTEPDEFGSWGTEYLHNIEEGLLSYVLCTEDDVVEVLSAKEPEWIEVPSGKGQSPLPMSSNHFYHPEDKDQIEDIANRIRDSNG